MRRFLIAGAVLLAGCGAEASSSGKFQGEQRAVADAVEEVQTAAERRDGEKLCRDLLAAALRDRIADSGTSCDKEMEKAVKDADSFELDVATVTVTGDKAQAEVRGENGRGRATATFELVKENGAWRVSAFGPGQLVKG